ncbi:hypothetical protein [Clostridium frigidicarnis]|nr:hypothetical protein [Clostridium frigidicarnis]
MSDSVNWENIWQSVLYFGVSTFGWIIVLIVVILLIKYVFKKKNA